MGLHIDENCRLDLSDHMKTGHIPWPLLQTRRDEPIHEDVDSIKIACLAIACS